MKTAALVRSFFCIVGISFLALQFIAPVPALADPPPACTPKPSPLPTPPFSGGPECPPATDCQPCVEDPNCSPPPWPSVSGNEPWMIPISGPTPGDGTHLEWRIFPPGWSYSPATSPSPWPSPQPPPGPAVLLVHGGSWVSGDPFQPQVERVAEIIAQDGFWVFVGDYRLAPCGKIPGQPPHPSVTPTPSGTPTPTPDPSGRPPEQTDDIMFLLNAIRLNEHFSGKVGIVAVSSGGNISSYVGLYRDTINQSGRPQWNINGDTDRPDCVVTFSSPFDLSDQHPDDPDNGFDEYINGIHNYIGTCNRDVARQASPISLVTSGINSSFKPLFIIQAKDDPVCPSRQVDDLEAALIDAGVGACKYQIALVPHDDQYHEVHGLRLWQAPDPNHPSEKIGKSVLLFLHQNLDN
jgi:acetyl esterase/lipase